MLRSRTQYIMAKRYRKVDFLGEGQFATVYKAEDTEDNGHIVAVKKIKLGISSEAKDGINRTALREIKLLQELRHPNIINLKNVFGQKSNISLIFDYMDTDLEVVIRDPTIILSPSNIKAYLLMTLQGLQYLHKYWVLHRDLKPNNLLINNAGVLKITDFGLAKAFGSPSRPMTHQVVTRWYRSPELLFGARLYGTGVDMWAVGCIAAELTLGAPFLPGDTDLAQLTKIFEVRGTPSEETWPGVTKLPDFVKYNKMAGVVSEEIFTAASNDLIRLLDWCLTLDPSKRCTATQALKSDYFSNTPAPTPGPQLPLPKTKDEKRGDIDQVVKRVLFKTPPN